MILTTVVPATRYMIPVNRVGRIEYQQMDWPLALCPMVNARTSFGMLRQRITEEQMIFLLVALLRQID